MPQTRVVVVDNASGNGSVEKIRASLNQADLQDWATTLPLHRNGGFACGNNAAVRRAMRDPNGPEYFMLLNPDTIVHPGAVAELLSFMKDHPRVGIAGSRLEDPDGTPHCTAHRRFTVLSELDGAARLGVLSRLLRRHTVSPPIRNQAHPCDWVSGAAMIVRRSVFETVGLLDENYFLYFDEVDFCYRAKQHGWEVWYVPQSRIMHLEGSATRIRQTHARRQPYWYASRRRFFLKAYGLTGLILADVVWLTGRLSLAVRRLLRLGGCSEDDPAWFTFDLIWGDAKSILSGQAVQVGRREKSR